MKRYGADDWWSPSSTRGSERPPTLVIGLGNPILGDDGVGWRVAEALQQALSDRGDPAINRNTPESLGEVEVECLSLGGLSLMEHLVGYDNVIIIDAMETGDRPQGAVQIFSMAELADPMKGHTASAHDTSLQVAIEVGRTMGAELPDQVTVVAIESAEVYDFSEELSPPAAAAVPIALKAVWELLPKNQDKP